MDSPQRTVLAGSISVATILLTAALAGAAGPASNGGTSAASGGGAHAGGGAPAAAPAHASAPVATPAPGPAPSHAVSPSPAPAPAANHTTTPPPNPGNNTGNGDRRARWRHRDDHGNYTYSNGNFYSPYPYNGYINASPDGFYNGYYGYNGDFNNNYNDYYNNSGPPVAEPNSTANSAPAQPAPTPTGNTSAASAEAMAENSVNNNPQMIAANAAVHDAQQAFDTERRRVIQALEQQSDYKAALAKRGAAQQQLNTAKQGDAVPDPAQIAPAAAAKMNAGDDVTRMQQQAIENDPAAKAAEQRLTEAVQRRDQLRAEISKKYQ